MKERIKAKLLSLSKTQLVFAIVIGLVIAVGASAALLSVYVTLTGTAEVEQSLVFDGTTETSLEYTMKEGENKAIAGNTYTETATLHNKSDATAPIEIVTNQCEVSKHHCGDTNHNEEGIDTKYYGQVVLENKNSNWEPIITDAMTATLTYELAATKFNYELEAAGLETETEYSLIYYADQDDRFENWGGNNPGALIAAISSDDDGNISTIGEVNLKMDLPHENDWNSTAAANYCKNTEGDDFGLCRGAKIWLVPSADYSVTEKKLTTWNHSAYLFETDLITYHDTNNGTALNMFTGQMDIYIKNILAVNLAPATYKVKTSVNPVQ